MKKLDIVVKRIKELKFLVEYCDMNKSIKQLRDSCDLINTYDLISDQYFINITEKKILKKIKEYPTYFPWEQDKAIRIIQKACYNWLWKPKTNDWRGKERVIFYC